MTQFPRKYVVLIALDAVTILVVAALMLRSSLQLALAIMTALFIVNIFLVPLAFREQIGESEVSDKGRSKLWFWGFAFLAAALVQSAFFIQSGFSWPGFAGVVSGILLGTLFLLIAKKSKE